MDIGKLVSGIALGSALAVAPVYASRPQSEPTPYDNTPLTFTEEERALSAEILANIVLTRFPHPQAQYACRSDQGYEFCVARLTLPEGKYVIGARSRASAGTTLSQLSLFHPLEGERNLTRQNLVGIYDLTQDKLTHGNPVQFDQDLAMILEAYAPLLMIPDEEDCLREL